jgi:MFS transporter, ACS family, solute carrier family 17 (sodium-dependent inorganic phosphate cotransporter), other
VSEDAHRARIPRRHVVVGMAFLASVVGYTDRVNISVAAVAMKEQLGWSQTQKGLVLSAFFVGYMLFMFASGWLATRFGGKRVLGLSVLAWSVVTLLTPFAAQVSLAALFAARVAIGVGEAGLFPATYELFGRWVPASERSRAVARMLSGIPIGTVVGVIATAWVVTRFGWPMAFYAFGAVGLVWVAAFFREVENDPADDPRVGAEERALLPAPDTATRSAKVPWRRLLLRWPVLAVIVGHFASTWNLYVLLSWLPSYFRDVQHLTIANAGLFSAAPWLTNFAGTQLAGIIADRLIARGVHATFVRKLMQCVGLVGAAAFLLALRDVDSAGGALALLCAAMGAQGLCVSGFAPAMMDVAPRHGALIYGVSNTFATVPGIVGVTATGWLVDRTGTYTAGFVLAAGVSAVAALLFGLLFEARPLQDDDTLAAAS